MEVIIGLIVISISFYIVGSILKAIYSSFMSIFSGQVKVSQGPTLESNFLCPRCGQYRSFTQRSLKAWYAGQKPVCKKCHERWLAEEARRKRSGFNPLGCLMLLGVIVFLFIIIASV